MDLNLNILTLARGLSGHAAERQAVIAQNVANADTPDYKAKDIAPFSEVYAGGTDAPMAMLATRPGHLGAGADTPNFAVVETSAFASESPNGNTVSIEDQMMRAADVKRSHDLALGVYAKSMDILRMALGRR
ncbi:MAG: FlgB family protein [Pseudomonadota bacterium]